MKKEQELKPGGKQEDSRRRRRRGNQWRKHEGGKSRME